MELGLYESVITAELERQLKALIGREADVTSVDLADQTLVLARHMWHQPGFKRDWPPSEIQLGESNSPTNCLR